MFNLLKSLVSHFNPPRITPAQRDYAVDYWLDYRRSLNLPGKQVPEERLRRALEKVIDFSPYASTHISLSLDLRYALLAKVRRDEDTRIKSLEIGLSREPAEIMYLNTTGGIVLGHVELDSISHYEKIYQDPSVPHLPYVTQSEIENWPQVTGTIRQVKTGQQFLDLADLAPADPSIDVINQGIKIVGPSVRYHHTGKFAGTFNDTATGVKAEVYGFSHRDDYRHIVKVTEHTGDFYRAGKTGVMLDGTVQFEAGDLMRVRDGKIQPAEKPYRFIESPAYRRLEADPDAFVIAGLR